MENRSKELDKFYTNPKVIDKLLKEIDWHLKSSGIIPSQMIWIEPSAGSGNFIDVLKQRITHPKILAYDIEPKNNKKIKKADFLTLNLDYNEKNLIFGNPPFGKRANMAINFINKSSEISDIIAFILPNQFKRYLTQKKVNENFKLIFQKKIEHNSFLIDDRAYNVNCVFQIWMSKKRKEFDHFKDKRLYSQRNKKSKDLELFIHNNTKATQKYFSKEQYGWDYAVHRQGYYDYSQIFKNENELNIKRQYLFIKCKNEICKKTIPKMNFKKISNSNTSTPGFSTEDFIKEYNYRKYKK